MLRSYILIGLRNILKNKLVSLLNIVGLSLAFGCIIVIFIFIEFNFSVDRFHTQGDRIYLVTHTKQNSGWDYGKTPLQLGPLLKEEAPGTEEVVRLQLKRATVIPASGEPFYEFITFTDVGYFNLFDFTLMRGQPAALQDPSKVIISYETAKKYFGDDNPVGENLEIYLPEGEKFSVSIAGVADPFPLKRSFEFNFLINRKLIEQPADEQWDSFADATFIKTRNANSPDATKTSLDKFKENYNLKNPDDQIASFKLEPLATLAQESYHIRNTIVRGYGPPSGKIAFSIIGLLLITLACLNYISIATALGIARLKEIGIRKVIGGKRSAIIWQFLTENFIINVAALTAGVVLAIFVLIPGFDSLFQIGLSFEFTNGSLWIFLLGVLIVTSLLAGAYPALYISKYKPVAILSGINKIGTKGVFSKVLLSFQFLLSFIYIVASLLFIANETYQRGRDPGYQNKNLLIVQPADKSAYTFLKNELSKDPGIERIAGSQHHIGSNYNEITVQVDTTEVTVHEFVVDSAYVETLQLKFVQGSSLASGVGADSHGVIINEKFARYMGWDNALERSVKIDNETYHIQGVVRDFRYAGFQRAIEPVLFRLSNEAYFSFLSIRVREGEAQKINENLKLLWKKASPHVPFNGFYQEQTTERYFALMSGHSKVMTFSAVLAVTLACLGLFGLVYLNVVARIKDYSIMKILGIDAFALSRQVVKIFILFLVIAIVLGFPASMVLSKILFKIVYSDYIAITMFYPFMGALLLTAISLATVSFLIIRLLKKNPVDALRN